MTSHFKEVLGHKIHYRTFGVYNKGQSHVSVYVHGLLRCCRDFDVPAAAVSAALKGYAITIDIIGRGESSWSTDPEAEYQRDYYAKLVGQFLAEVLEGPVAGEGCIPFDFIGTSMGGLIAMAGVHFGFFHPRRVVLNDIGPDVDMPVMIRIVQQVMKPPVCDTKEELEALLTEQYRPFGFDLTDAQMHLLIAPCMREKEVDGKAVHTVHWDPAILKGLKPPPPGTPTAWDMYFTLLDRCAGVYVLRGAESDVLTPRILSLMYFKGKAHKKAKAGLPTDKEEQNEDDGDETYNPFVGVEIKRAGHAPALLTATEIETLVDFLKPSTAKGKASCCSAM